MVGKHKTVMNSYKEWKRTSWCFCAVNCQKETLPFIHFLHSIVHTLHGLKGNIITAAESCNGGDDKGNGGGGVVVVVVVAKPKNQ
jgi:hypothetical protein